MENKNIVKVFFMPLLLFIMACEAYVNEKNNRFIAFRCFKA
ncbi:hypothetical protein [Borreliella afzelii]